jgi:hypothetical protein
MMPGRVRDPPTWRNGLIAPSNKVNKIKFPIKQYQIQAILIWPDSPFNVTGEEEAFEALKNGAGRTGDPFRKGAGKHSFRKGETES